MNTISSLETTDLPAAYHIEQRAHAFPWSEKTFASNQGERYLNFQLTQNGKMAAFAITQVVLDEATLFNIAVDPDYQRQGLGRARRQRGRPAHPQKGGARFHHCLP